MAVTKRPKYPPIVVTATRKNGGTPPHLMGEEERRVWATNECLIWARSIGAVPISEVQKNPK